MLYSGLIPSGTKYRARRAGAPAHLSNREPSPFFSNPAGFPPGRVSHKQGNSPFFYASRGLGLPAEPSKVLSGCLSPRWRLSRLDFREAGGAREHKRQKLAFI